MSFVDEVVRQLGDQSVRVRHDTTRSRLLQKVFPFTVGRVDWRRVPGAQIRAAPNDRALGTNSPDVPFQTKTYLPVVIEFFDDALASRGIDDDRRVEDRYGKRSASLFAMVCLAAVVVWLAS
jgi:hypothetical protein